MQKTYPFQDYHEFNRYNFTHRVPFAMYADFEAWNKIADLSHRFVRTQHALSYGIYLKSDYENIIKSEYVSYYSDDCCIKLRKLCA